ncbi:HVA22-like protein d [Cyclospora cayetanensis]|uniref:HVA22-like protein d n=2 Tax=Cyclospora cayetanensis TaxID=88456 RepID=A0A6P5WCM5_9EIME|nr:HVA22-like protein d [Cyclospora cayetanensis]OEH74471.1 TB2 HVA22 domain-containing protein [Cyclospora cayetanensis]
MAFTILGPILGSLLCFSICFVYPASLTFQLLLKEKGVPCGALNNDHLQHVVFWILSSWICCMESFPPIALLCQYIPLYYEIKCVLFYWLASPQFKGAGWLWLNVLNPAYEKAAPVCSQMYSEQCHPKIKSAIEKVIGTIVGRRAQQSEAFNKSRQPSKTTDTAKAD